MGIAATAAAVLMALLAGATLTAVMERLISYFGREPGPARAVTLRRSIDQPNADRWLLPAGPAAALTLALLSLAGIPPLAGFAGKIFLLTAAIDGGMTWLAIVGVINMAVGLYYYARVIAEMYFRAPEQPGPTAGGLGYTVATATTTAGSIAFGIAPAAGISLATFGELLLR